MKKKINTERFILAIGLIFTIAMLIFNIFCDFISHTLRSDDVSKTDSAVQATTVPLKININTADAALLAQLDMIGDFKAKKIVEYRRTHGKFKSTRDITDVPGIGEKIFENNKHRLTVK